MNNILPFREMWADKLKKRLKNAADHSQPQYALHDHIRELTEFAERKSRMMSRLVNMMTTQDLEAYDEIAAKLGKDATDKQWNAAIKEWKQKQPRMSDTPLTDAAVKELLQTSQHERVKAEFARELEREVARLKAELTQQRTPPRAS